MKKTAFIVFAFFVGIITQAQNADKAKKLLDDVTAKIKSYKNITINFDYKRSGNSQSGTMVLEGDKYNIKTMGITQLYDGFKTYTIQPDDEEVIISKTKNSSNSITPSKILSFFHTGYHYIWSSAEKVSGKNIQYIKLTPTDTKSSTKEIILGIDTNTKHIYNIVEVFKNGGKSTITVKSFKTNQSLPKNQFTFVKSNYPNYYINNID